MNNMDNFVIIDTETSGTSPFSHQILSAAFVPMNNDLPSKEFFIKPADGLLKISWSEFGFVAKNFENFRGVWEEQGKNPDESCSSIECYLSETFPNGAIPVGHNIAFDLSFLDGLAHMTGRQRIKGLSYRSIDTHTLLMHLHLSGRIPESALSSSGAFEYFGIRVEGRHTAMGDAIATKELYARLLLHLMPNCCRGENK